jgi:uncharacterized C2H2 Zn-finger protein
VKSVTRQTKRAGRKKAAGPKARAGRKTPAALQCPHCSRTFKGQGHLDRHVAKAHSQPAVEVTAETLVE